MDISPVANHSFSMSRWPPRDVFLSFRGADTRKNFAKFLYMWLTRDQVNVFIDEKDLEKGKNTNDGLIEAINQSVISIPIISKDYKSSKSCLMELVHMLKRMDNKNHIVIPIFYYVDPSDIRHCNGPFATSLLGHEDGHNNSHINDEDIGSWKHALERIGSMNGYHLYEENEVDHMEIMERITCEVRQKLKKEDLIVPEQLVGVDCHVQSIMEKLKVDYHDGQADKIDETLEKVLVISGITGVGKTVLAKYVYNKLLHLYDHCSFCQTIQVEIERDGVLSVQNKLISHLQGRYDQKFDSSDKALIHIKYRLCTMKVLLLLDDVNCDEQLSALVGKLDWLGPGSRVIVTSQRQDVHKNINGAESFVLEPLEENEALKLFCRHAFGTDSPREKFETLSKEIVKATDRLPFALKLVGSSLFLAKKRKAWREMLTALEVGPHERVQAALERSYANLNKNQREIFLDIACFFIGKDMRIPYYMWANRNCCPSISILALDACSFVKIGEDKELCMHGILQKFGRAIVEDESPQPCGRSRLWKHKDALNVLISEQGTGQVTALRLEFGDGFVEHLSFGCDNFDGLKNLRFLKLDRADIQGNFQNCFSTLKWLDWQGGPKILDLQPQYLNLQNLVIFDLSGSLVDKDWRGWDLLEEAKKLKVLKLTGCFRLTATPNFPASMELEILILEGCHKLAFVEPSIGCLDKLVSLNMKQCNGLYELPNLSRLTCLKELVIDGTSISRINFQEGFVKKLKILSACNCKELTEISDSIGYLKSLGCLALDSTKVQTLPESIVSLEKLKTLSLKNCRSLFRLPDWIGKLGSLQFLDISDTMIRELPPSVKDWVALKVLRMRGTYIEEFPKAILNLGKLEEIDFSSCRSLKGSIQDLDIWKLSSLTILRLSCTQICCLPESFHCLSRLQELDIFQCDNLQRLPKLPSSLINIRGRSDLSPLDPDVMNEGVGQKRRQDRRERAGDRERHMQKKKGRKRSTHREEGCSGE